MENKDLIVENSEQSNTDDSTQTHFEPEKCECSESCCQHSVKAKSAEESIDSTKEKILPFVEINDELKLRLKESVYSLLLLKEEVDFRTKFILERIAAIKDKANNLAVTYKFKLDGKEHERAEESVNQYAKLLEGISKEVERELVLSYMLLNEGEKKLEKLVAPINGPASFEEYVSDRIKWTKKFVKDLNKNLSVSYSRYLFGFEDQERQLEVLEANLKHYASKK